MPDAPTEAMTTGDGPPRSRRTQDQRRAQTRTKLLDATIQSLLDVGYPGTTTRHVAKLAGVSSGAQTHHFPHRVDLVGAAIEHLAERRTTAIRDLAADLPTAPSERVGALLDLLWASFSSPVFTAFVKLWVAAADDPELYARLVPVERQLARSIAALADEFAGEFASQPGWEGRLLMVLSTMRGLALTERFEPRGARRRDNWPAVRSAMLEVLQQSA